MTPLRCYSGLVLSETVFELDVLVSQAHYEAVCYYSCPLTCSRTMLHVLDTTMEHTITEMLCNVKHRRNVADMAPEARLPFANRANPHGYTAWISRGRHEETALGEISGLVFRVAAFLSDRSPGSCALLLPIDHRICLFA
jgi:hypothetical protein